MTTAPSKISSVFKLCLALFVCAAVSLGVYLVATPFIYGAWHCPPPRRCETPAWADYTVFLILLSPLLVFAIGAYLCRHIVAAISHSKILRSLILLVFGLFPLLALAALIAYIVSDTPK